MPRARTSRESSRVRPYSNPDRNRGRRSDARNKPLLIDIEDSPDSNEKLKIENVELMREQNQKEHHTDEYEIENLIVRRGQSFSLQLDLNKDYDESSDTFTLKLQIGDRPMVSRGTLVYVPSVTSEPPPNEWGVQVVKFDGGEVTLCVFIPASCIVCPYKVVIVAESKSGPRDDHKHSHIIADHVYILFNPWCKLDTVYMAEDTERQEYVLEDTGAIWYGTSRCQGNMPWYYGQFDTVVLDVCFGLLKRSGLAVYSMDNPVNIARTMSAMVNAQDDNGVLVGNWSGDYSDGTPPGDWNGSVAILEEYEDTGEPVKYGQCWVFAGILTTVMRALGIPARPVTNFESAHDTDANLTLDTHFNEDGDPIDELNEDSIWNFHVWNDVWMVRNDLPAGYGGWQAVDATPQETSEGVFRTGPSPLAAIKLGEVYFHYDTKFLFAEVNSEAVNWMVMKNGDIVEMDVDRAKVGKCILTKAVGKDEVCDVTSAYKHTEGTPMEMIAVCNAQNYVKCHKKAEKATQKDVCIVPDAPSHLMIGEDVYVPVHVKNKSSDKRKVFVAITANVVHYTGVKACTLKTHKETVTVDPGKEKDVRMVLPVSEYVDKLVEGAQVRFSVVGMVAETKQTFVGQEIFQFKCPVIEIETEGDLAKGHEFTAQLKFKNPLPRKLNGCSFRLEGPGIHGALKKKYKNINPYEDVCFRIKLTPKRSGRRKILANFTSKQLSGVLGSKTIEFARDLSTPPTSPSKSDKLEDGSGEGAKKDGEQS